MKKNLLFKKIINFLGLVKNDIRISSDLLNKPVILKISCNMKYNNLYQIIKYFQKFFVFELRLRNLQLKKLS